MNVNVNVPWNQGSKWPTIPHGITNASVQRISNDRFIAIFNFSDHSILHLLLIQLPILSDHLGIRQKPVEQDEVPLL